MNIWGDIICGAFIYIVLPLMSFGCFIGAFILWKYHRFSRQYVPDHYPVFREDVAP